jgi:hypothetical protein
MKLNLSARREPLAKAFEQFVMAIFRGQGSFDQTLRHIAEAAKKSDVGALLLKAAPGKADLQADAYNAYIRQPNFLVDVQRAAVAAGTTSDGTWASPLVARTTLATAFLESLYFTSALDNIGPDMQAWRPGTQFAISSGTAAGGSSAQATWKPLTKNDWTTDLVEPLKAHALVVVMNDLLRDSAGLAEAAITSELRRATSVAADDVLFGILTAGLTPIACSGDARGDLDAALGAINLGKNSRLHMFLPSAVLKQLVLRGAGLDGPATFPDLTFAGGSIGGMSVMPVDALADTATFGNAIVIVDAAQLAGFAGTLVLDAAQEGTLWFDDVGGGTAAKSTVSLFQTSASALRVERWFACERPRATSVAVISNAHYSSGSP